MGASFAERLKGGIASGNAAGVGGADIVLKSARRSQLRTHKHTPRCQDPGYPMMRLARAQYYFRQGSKHGAFMPAAPLANNPARLLLINRS